MKTRCIIGVTLALTLSANIPLTTGEGYSVPQPGHSFNFPRDHGSHPDFKIEWWYLTGHLDGQNGERFGYQATFFRRALTPPADQTENTSRPAFGNEQIYLTHMALTDVRRKTFYHEERFNRNGWDALAASDTLAVKNGNWRLTALERPEPDPANPDLHLQFTVEDSVAVDLKLSPTKPLLIFGPDGTSRKGAHPAARSYYLTWSRLAAVGTVTIDGHAHDVTGLSWMDHEIASMQLGEDLEGWDWTAIQLADNWEIKAYLLRQNDGQPSPFSALIWIDPEGNKHYRGPEDFTWKSLRSWTSPETGSTYPIEIEITTLNPRTEMPVALRLRPVIDAQELSNASAGFAYWEGACDVFAADGTTLGRAYLELVGYGGSTGDGLR